MELPKCGKTLLICDLQTPAFLRTSASLQIHTFLLTHIADNALYSIDVQNKKNHFKTTIFRPLLKHSNVQYFVEICKFAICRLSLKICGFAICDLRTGTPNSFGICDCGMSPRILRICFLLSHLWL